MWIGKMWRKTTGALVMRVSVWRMRRDRRYRRRRREENKER